MDPGTYAAVFVVVVVASTLQSSVGMGQGLVAAPLLRMIEPDLLPGPLVFAGLLTSSVLAARNTHRSDVVEVLPALAGRLIGAAAAVVLLAVLSERGLTVMIGAVVLAVVALRLRGVKIDRTRRTLAATGAVSGVSGTIASLGGAPMGLLYEQHSRARGFRGPMGAFQTVGGVMSVALLTAGGVMDGRSWSLAIWLLPPLAIGWILARWVTPVVDRGMLGPIVLAVSSASAVVLLASELL